MCGRSAQMVLPAGRLLLRNLLSVAVADDENIISQPGRNVGLGLLRQILFLFHMRVNTAPIEVNGLNCSRILFGLSASDELPVCCRQEVRYQLSSVSLDACSIARCQTENIFIELDK